MRAGRHLRSLVVGSSFLGSTLLGEAETNTLKCCLALHALSTVTWCDWRWAWGDLVPHVISIAIHMSYGMRIPLISWPAFVIDWSPGKTTAPAKMSVYETLRKAARLPLLCFHQ